MHLSIEVPNIEVDGGQLGVDIEVRPIGVKFKSKIFSKLFPENGEWPQPNLTEEELKLLSDFLWKESDAKFWFDFGDEEHLYKLLL